MTADELNEEAEDLLDKVGLISSVCLLTLGCEEAEGDAICGRSHDWENR